MPLLPHLPHTLATFNQLTMWNKFQLPNWQLFLGFCWFLFFSLLFFILLVANEAHQMIQHCCGLLAIKFSACLF